MYGNPGIFACGIRNTTTGIRNPSDDCNPDPSFTVEDWHPEYMAWIQESKTITITIPLWLLIITDRRICIPLFIPSSLRSKQVKRIPQDSIVLILILIDYLKNESVSRSRN